jgi:hypothetical protein
LIDPCPSNVAKSLPQNLAKSAASIGFDGVVFPSVLLVGVYDCSSGKKDAAFIHDTAFIGVNILPYKILVVAF